MNVIDWVKHNKLTTFLLLVIIYIVFFRNPVYTPYATQSVMDSYNYGSVSSSEGIMNMAGVSKSMPPIGIVPPDMPRDSANPNTADRRVVTETNLSLQVSDVPNSISEIKSKVESLKGFMVNSNVSRPEEAASGSITIRVPTTSSDEMISFLKEKSIKVVNEDVQGRDITDQYTDIETRLATLQKNKARFEVIMDKAESVNEILQVQSQIFQLQDQIDSLIGQRDYLKNTSETVKITAYLATDEFALPYVPDTSWRPNVVFKEAVRALILDIRGFADKIIWLAVYAVIWIPILLIAFAGYRYWKNRSIRISSGMKS